MIQRRPFQEFHYDERPAFMFCDFVYGADVGMVEGRRGTRLPAKAFQHLRVFCNVFRQELQSDKATEFGVLGLIDHTHPAAAQLLDDAVVRNGLTDHLRECYGVRSGKSMYGLTARTPEKSLRKSGDRKGTPKSKAFFRVPADGRPAPTPPGMEFLGRV